MSKRSPFPLFQQLYCLPPHVVIKAYNLAGLLQKWNKFTGRNDFSAGGNPPGQHFSRHHLAMPIHLRLQVYLELTSPYCLFKSIDQCTSTPYLLELPGPVIGYMALWVIHNGFLGRPGIFNHPRQGNID